MKGKENLARWAKRGINLGLIYFAWMGATKAIEFTNRADIDFNTVRYSKFGGSYYGRVDDDGNNVVSSRGSFYANLQGYMSGSLSIRNEHMSFSGGFWLIGHRPVFYSMIRVANEDWNVYIDSIEDLNQIVAGN